MPAVQRVRRTVEGLAVDTYLLSGVVGRYPVYRYVTPKRLAEVELKGRIRWRLSQPRRRRPLRA